MPPPVNMIDPFGEAHSVSADRVQSALDSGWTIESGGQGVARVAGDAEADAYSGLGDQINAYGAGVARGFTGGLSDVGLGAIGADTRYLRKVRENNALVSGAGELVGGITGAATGVGPIGEAAALGGRVAQAAEGAGTIARIGRAAAGAAVEGGAMGLGEGVSELALSEDPLTVERAVSTLSSRTLYGAGIGAAAGTLAKGAEIGLTKARAALDEVATRTTAAANVGDDLARLDAKGLKAAETAEREAIEAARVTQRKELADELIAFRQELKGQKHAIITKDVRLPAAGEKLSTAEIGRISLKANRQLDNLLDNPVGLAKNPAKALDALQRQENALAKLAERTDDLRTVFAADTSGARAAALDTIPAALERNRALQAKITQLTGEATSPRLTQIAEAREALQAGGGPKTLAEQMAGGAVYSTVTGAVAALPIPGSSLLAPMLGARASSLVSEKVFGRLGQAMSEGQARAAKAIGAVFERGARVARKAPPVATRVLGAVAFAPAAESAAAPRGGRKLAQLYRERTAELREQVETGPAGTPVVRRAARQRIADQLAPVAAFQPMLADRMETLAVRRLEFLAGKMPRRPELGDLQLGPDNWEPSDMEMRTFARFVAAAEDPDGIVERLADGTVTPEDAETMRELYPEQLADITRQILERLPTLSATLPYHRRLALSVLTGVAVDPSMDPRILATLQGQYAAEEQAPKATPQFGSVSTKTEIGTPSERREQRT